MKKNGISGLQYIFAALGTLILTLAILPGCEDPGPSGQTYIYDRHVEVVTKNQAPPMNDPLADIWNDVPITILSFAKDPDVYFRDFKTLELRLSAIKYSDRIYLKALWGYDTSYNASPRFSSFSHDYFYPEITSLLSFDTVRTDSFYYYPTPDDSIKIVEFSLDQTSETYRPSSNTTGAPDTTTYTICTPTPDSVDTFVNITNEEWYLLPTFVCETRDTILNYNNDEETWTRRASIDLDTIIERKYTHIENESDTIVDSIDYSYVNSGYDQDRIAIMWDMGNNGSEGANCMTMCHDVGMESTLGHRMYTTGGGTVDVWHWQSALSNPIYLAIDEIWADSGRVTDEAFAPIYETNWDTINAHPIYMHQTDTLYTGKSFLLKSEAVPLITNPDFWPQGFTIPGYVVNEMATGSATDVDTYAWRTTLDTWYVLMSRKLNTGNADDVDLSTIATGDSIMTSIAIMDNASEIHHIVDEPIYFIFK